MKIKQQSGFALIEQVIIIGIIGFLAVISIFSFSDITVQQRQETAIEELYYSIRKVQNYAVTGRQAVTEEIPAQYGVYIQDEHTYFIYADQNEDFVFDPIGDVVIETLNVPSDVFLSPVNVTISSIVPTGMFCINQEHVVGGQDCESNLTIEVFSSAIDEVRELQINTVIGHVTFN